MEGLINVLKPPGMTSHDVISYLRRTLGIKKIGHCGTLDPQAAGVLPVCLHQATKLADYLAGGEKSYYCEMKLGFETDTQDVWGTVTKTYSGGSTGLAVDEDVIRGALSSLVGAVMQEVPAYSSVKRDGKSLHQYARKGEQVTGIMRQVEIHAIDLVGFGEGRIRFIVKCGAGTYVRMLCRDIGRLLGVGGTMAFLLRLEVGPFALEDSVTLEEIGALCGAEGASDEARRDAEGAAIQSIIRPKELALWHMPYIRATAEEAMKLRQGQAQWLAWDGSGMEVAGAGATGARRSGGNPDTSQDIAAWVMDGDNRLVALGNSRPGKGKHEGKAWFKPTKTFT